MKKIGLILLSGLWGILALLAWVKPAQGFSLTERRQLAQRPEITAEALLSGDFMESFESYTLDQFPLREGFRSIKALTHYYALGQQDNNGIYLSQGHIAELSYPLNRDSVSHAIGQFQKVYDLYLQENEHIVSAIVPDKGYYLDTLSMDYDALFAMMAEGMPWAEQVDITKTLTIGDYYCTDTHWRQEDILSTAEALADALGVTVGKFTAKAVQTPFYGVYYGQAALPAQPDTMYLMESDTLAPCRVYNYTTGQYTDVYDLDKLAGNDPYEVYLSGAQSLLRVENPNAKTGRELVIFRDSFGSAMAPLLMEDYAAIYLVDIRYIFPEVLGQYIDFADKDILFLYSTLVLNKNLI